MKTLGLLSYYAATLVLTASSANDRLWINPFGWESSEGDFSRVSIAHKKNSRNKIQKRKRSLK